MREVKGTMFVVFAKTIRADKSGVYDALLTDEDKEIIAQRILSVGWYPFETYKNCFNAVYKVEGKNDPEICRQWGRINGELTMTSIYQGAIKKGDPEGALNLFKMYYKNMFNFGEMIFDMLSGNETIIKIKDFDANFEPYYNVVRGWMERFLELCVDKSVKSEFVSKSWRGDSDTKIKLRWD